MTMMEDDFISRLWFSYRVYLLLALHTYSPIEIELIKVVNSYDFGSFSLKNDIFRKRQAITANHIIRATKIFIQFQRARNAESSSQISLQF